MKRDYKEKEKNPEERSAEGYSLGSAAYSMGHRGPLFKRPSSQPPPLELTCGDLEVFFKNIWPEKK